MMKCKRKNGWNCNICRGDAGTGEISYYCYCCDFDICPACYEYIIDKTADNSVHTHPIVYILSPGGYTCDLCSKHYNSGRATWKCKDCDFDQCFFCRFQK